jgi:inner membrane protein YidH
MAIDDRDDVGIDPDPRLSFANERTFLAWIRTAMTLVAAGIAVGQLVNAGDLSNGNRALALALLAAGGTLAIVSYRRWRACELAMRRSQPLPRSRMLDLVAVVVGIAAVVGALVTVLG